MANSGSNTVSAINAATSLVVGDPTPVGTSPSAFGQFIVEITDPSTTFCGYPGALGMGYYSFRAENGEDVTVTMTKNPQGTSRGN